MISKRAFEPLAFGSVVGYIILYKVGFFGEWVTAYLSVIADNAWFWLLFFLFGSVVRLLTASGGALGFTKIGSRIAKTRPRALMITWVLGLAIFIDDFLNNLAIGTAMKGITDRLGISRHLLAYVVNSTGASICVIVPVSTWAVFMQGLYEQQGILVNGTGLGAFIAAIPYMWYPMAVILVAPFYIFGIIPLYGPIRKEERLAGEAALLMESNGGLSKSDALSARFENFILCKAADEEEANEFLSIINETKEEMKGSNPLNFVIPLIAITGITIYTSDMLIGVMIGLALMFVMYIPQKIMKIGDYFDNLVTGMCDMMIINCLVSAYFCLQTANDQLGVAEYVISKVYPLMNASTLPIIAFLVVSALAFVTGSFWGMPAIAFPILIPLAAMYGNNPLVIGAAIVSAGAFGSSACFYGDAVTLVCAATNIKNYDYARTVIPLLGVPLVLTLLVYIGYGIFFA
jgi:Na+/H+ antiporter NhaC